ncbi:diphthine synthase [Spizellomyces punctatus DAOM BR117]|uniref:diphthine methyl ester synthase n=1 Tax=Spizellomyces punctatus (strain DAOM BR117) TaxID=645134 RepID=A0A0L0HN39_SPIPD|nr:diphthine synthase [Spizellomyces punctatus DAOM BR117]KND02478.1 diphthine synthase [Spizellomyces punctatus DAOM BR117]|eukprot:XP_016610517.1 diphthine synthase [Spizellomyces punctatus DAOM BR117]
MVLYIIGLGLSDEKDITVKGLEAVKSCSRIYLEAYTSILGVGKERLEAFYERPVIIADRDMVETESDAILQDADKVNVAFLVVGDPFGATTHTDLVLRAQERGIPTVPIHNASVMNAVGCCGLSLYQYGQTVSIVFFTETWRPDSFVEKIGANRQMGLHTLCLLDIKVKEQSIENLARGRKIYEPPRYMSIPTAITQLLSVTTDAYSPTTIAVGLARLGSATQQIVAGTLEELQSVDFGPPLHSLVICGKMHFLEADVVRGFAVSKETFDRYAEVSEH